MGNETIHRESNMSAHVLLNLLNEFGKKNKMRGFINDNERLYA